mgnify:CR=1 FL=1
MKRNSMIGILAAVLMLAIGITVSNTVAAGSQKESMFVMVELDVGFSPENTLKDQKAVYDQRKTIRDARDSVVRYLDGYEFEVSADLETIPYLG